MGRPLRVILSPWTTLVPLAAAVLLVLCGFLLQGTLHVFTLAHVTVVQFGDTFTVGRSGQVLVRSTRLWEVAVFLALPAMAWAAWFAIHLDSEKPKS